MAIVGDLREWIGKEVVDESSAKVGKFVDVYFDVESDEPVFLVVDPGRRSDNLLVPAWNAAVSPDHVLVPYTAEALAGAPALSPGGELDTPNERDLFTYYKVQYVPSQTGSGRRLIRH
jgi:sporulation protein YlmC with PRC-barrel domain